MSYTDAEIDRLLALAAAATPGPWRDTGTTCGADQSDVGWGHHVGAIDGKCVVVAETGDETRDAANAAFVIAAREAVPALCAALKEAHAEIRRLRDDVETREADLDDVSHEMAHARPRLRALETENARLRAALEQIAATTDWGRGPGDKPQPTPWARIALAVLEGVGHDGGGSHGRGVQEVGEAVGVAGEDRGPGGKTDQREKDDRPPEVAVHRGEAE